MASSFDIGDLCEVIGPCEANLIGRECSILTALVSTHFSGCGHFHAAHRIELQGFENKNVWARPCVLRKLPPHTDVLENWDECPYKPGMEVTQW